MALINKNNIKNCKVQKRENDYIDYMGIWAREMSEEFSHEINQRILEKMKEQAEMMIEKAKKYGEEFNYSGITWPEIEKSFSESMGVEYSP